MSYRVVTVEKQGSGVVGDLGEYESLKEAMKVINDYNRKADRHPAIATLELSEDVANAPTSKKPEKRSNPFSFGWDEDEKSEEESDSSEDWDVVKEEEEEIIREREEVDRISRHMEEESEEESEWEEESEDDEYTERQKSMDRPNFRNPFQSRGKRKNRFISDRDKRQIPRMARNSPNSTLAAPKITPKPMMMTSPRQNVYYGIIVTETGEVLVREPANHHGNIKWEFYGGKSEHGEKPEDTVVRETLEETGFMTRIIKPLGQWRDQKNNYYFFLLRPVGVQREWEGYGTDVQETWDTMYCNMFDAESLIKKNPDTPYRRVLLAALESTVNYQRRRSLR